MIYDYISQYITLKHIDTSDRYRHYNITTVVLHRFSNGIVLSFFFINYGCRNKNDNNNNIIRKYGNQIKMKQL